MFLSILEILFDNARETNTISMSNLTFLLFNKGFT